MCATCGCSDDAGVRVLFATPAIVMATTFVALPLMVREVVPVLKEIGIEQEQAAASLGANALQRFWRITMPLVTPLVVTMGLFRIVWSLASFDLVLGLTNGGPGVATSVLALQIFREGILFFKFGFASAITASTSDAGSVRGSASRASCAR